MILNASEANGANHVAVRLEAKEGGVAFTEISEARWRADDIPPVWKPGYAQICALQQLLVLLQLWKQCERDIFLFHVKLLLPRTRLHDQNMRQLPLSVNSAK